MKFGPVPLSQAEGAMLVHGQTLGGHRYRKGHVLDADDVTRLTTAGITDVTVAVFEAGDIDENTAASRLAKAATGSGVRAGIAGTGRVNLFARHAGLAMLDPATVDRINRVDEGITLSTLHPLDRVEAEQVVATIKIIPFAVSETNLTKAEAAARDTEEAGLISVRAYRPRTVGLIQTDLPGLPDKVLAKTEGVVRNRIEALGSTLSAPVTVQHDLIAIDAALHGLVGSGAELILIIGASATTDRRDVIPAAITKAGGIIEHFGMPVDPGNLTVLARIGDVPILALPGSARSPRLGGNDLLLERIMADIPVDGTHIMGLGVGGLFKEIPSRPLPRTHAAPRARRQEASSPRFAAIILAAGQSRRMGAVNKLLIKVDGKPMMRHAVDAAREAGADPVIVVTGHQPDDVQAAAGDQATFVHNGAFDEGLSTSLRVGLSAVPASCDGALIALGDMPKVGAEHLRRLVAAHDPDKGHLICVPTRDGKRGNPVFWDRRFFEDMASLGGDVGAKHLIGDYEDLVVEVPMSDDAVLTDVDSPAALERLAANGAKVKI
ncbi:MAG: molybdopterin-binding/glycosyltransferase family 2 protein [Proteobacteria bacterium]|nr:molybdopterin-binding/glycosyltransferase family 2 protein [Pseudomonadota bacterium]